MNRVMYDSVNAAAIGNAPAATAGYVDGNWANSATIKAQHPNVPHISIAVFARDDADALDCEPGDATIYEAPGWADRQYRRGIALPIIYTSASNIAELRRVMGGRNFLLWSAHYTYNAHVCGGCGYPGADATQFADKGPNGENVDQTLMSEAFYSAIGGASSLPPAPAPTPPPPPAPPALTGDNDMLGFIFRAKTGTCVFISVTGVRSIKDIGHLQDLLNRGYGYGPKQAKADTPDAAIWQLADPGPFQALIDDFGGLKP